MSDNWKYQYWLRCIHGVGNKKQRKLVEYCGGAKEIYRLSKEQLLKVSGIYEKDAEQIVKSRLVWDLEKEAQRLQKTGVQMVTIEDKEFPERLRHIPDCPYALFYKGNLLSNQERTAALVGARMCSSYGRETALMIGETLASHGISVISGMAYGIDSFGHWGAIRGGGATYAVLGSGADVCYPKGGRELYEKIQKEGGVLSEYLPKTAPVAAQFPARNRIISALSDIVILVEAKERSGSLITAEFALEQGKDIYAVPGRINDALSAGCNRLIAQGAQILTNLSDFLEELGVSSAAYNQEKEKENEKMKNALEKEELLVYSCLDLSQKNMEDLVKITKIPAQKLADLLVRLQTKGVIEEYYKNHYRKK
ncbi:MAG: DNA-protecting protein DprA [Eubacterium sp.]|jgi:DNA processing protein|nr:DNA-protecting protein DprA [Eubacterium sp.]